MKQASTKPAEETLLGGKNSRVLFRGLHSLFYLELVLCVSSLSKHDQQLSLLVGFLQDVYFAFLFENPDLEVIMALNQLKNANRAD